MDGHRYRIPGPTSSQEPPGRVVARLLTRYEVSSSGCWISEYSTGSHGYSQIGWQDKNNRYLWLGHRVSWYAHFGPIPEGATVDHKCRVRRCINPAHLRLLSNWDNARRNGRSEAQDYPESWSCPRNHGVPRRESNGQCPECHRENNARYRAKKKGAVVKDAT